MVTATKINKKQRLEEIKAHLLALDKDFFATPEHKRNLPKVDEIRNEIQRLSREAESLTTPPKLPRGFEYGHPSAFKDTVAYAVHILPATHIPIKAWGKVIAFDEATDKNLAKLGVEFRGSFLSPKGAPHLVQYAGRRKFVVAQKGKEKAFAKWYGSIKGAQVWQPRASLATRVEVVKAKPSPVTPEVTKELQAEYTKRMKPYHDKADAEIKKVNDDFMAPNANISLAENQAQRDAINAELDKQADKIRAEMGFPKPVPVTLEPRAEKAITEKARREAKLELFEIGQQVRDKDSGRYGIVRRIDHEKDQTIYKVQLEGAMGETSFTSAWLESAKPAPRAEKAEAVSEVKEPWQETRTDYLARLKERGADEVSLERLAIAHKKFIKQSLVEGKLVPPDVLKDYPDLKPITPEPKAEKGKATIEEIKGWPEAKKAWVRQEANKLTAKGFSPAIQELGMAYDERQAKKRVLEPKVEKPPRLTVRPKTYRGEEGYTVKGERTDIFFSKESQAREYVKRVKAGERSDQVLSDIWGIKQVRSGYTIAELVRIHAKRSPQSQASDERQKHQVTISPDSPRVKQWITDPGRADISGVDTPRLGGKTPRITPKTPKLRR